MSSDSAHGSPAPPRRRARRPPACTSATPCPGVAKVDPIIVADGVTPHLRRPHRRRRRAPRDPARRHHGAHRPERRRQDDAVQPAHGLRQARRRHVDLRRPSLSGVPAYRGRAHGPGPHLPAHEGARPAHGARQHEARREGPDAARRFWSEPDPRRSGASRTTRSRTTRHGAAREVQARREEATTSRRASPAGSASCSRWRGRS